MVHRPRLSFLSLMHRSAWKANAANFGLEGGQEVPPAIRPKFTPQIIGGPCKRTGRAKAACGRSTENHAAPARIFVMRPHGASRVAPWVKRRVNAHEPPRAFLALWWGSRARGPARGFFVATRRILYIS